MITLREFQLDIQSKILIWIENPENQIMIWILLAKLVSRNINDKILQTPVNFNFDLPPSEHLNPGYDQLNEKICFHKSSATGFYFLDFRFGDRWVQARYSCIELLIEDLENTKVTFHN